MPDTMPDMASVTQHAVAAALRRLTRGAEALAALPTADLRSAWHATVDLLRDPASTPGQQLRARLQGSSGLSPAGLDAALACMLDGVAGHHADPIFATSRRATDSQPGWVVLASNVPGLVVQPLLPALAVRRPLLVKSSSHEPCFAAYFVDLLCQHEPRLRDAVAALTWRGGDREMEAPLDTVTGPVVAYGDDQTLADLTTRFGPRLTSFGAQISIAVIGPEVASAKSSATVATGLARDIALFDQRGCLSIQAIFTIGASATAARREAEELAVSLAVSLAEALTTQATRWPIGSIAPGDAVAVQHLRTEADLRGLFRPALPLEIGTVIVDPDTRLRPSPGLRTVRIHPVARLDVLRGPLSPWQGRLQGVATAGIDSARVASALEPLGISRIAPPGNLQATNTAWRNGGVVLTEVFAGA